MRQRASTEKRSVVSVGMFLETGRAALGLELVAGAEGLGNEIAEAAINRPGLAISGFFKHFAWRRIQVLGLAEHAYLASLDRAQRERRLQEFFRKGVPCVVVARNKKVFPEVVELAEKNRIPLLRTRMITMHFVNAATIIMENLMAPRMTVQGTMVEIMGIGVMIEGRPGVGKSETALALLKRGHALVSDDMTLLRRDSAGSLMGCPVEATRYHMEIKGVGIIHIPSIFGVSSVREEKKLDLVVTLCDRKDREAPDPCDGTHRTRLLLGVQVPQVMLMMGPGRNIADIVETAALDQKLKRLGHDAVKELDERLISLLSEGKDASE